VISIYSPELLIFRLSYNLNALSVSLLSLCVFSSRSPFNLLFPLVGRRPVFCVNFEARQTIRINNISYFAGVRVCVCDIYSFEF